MKEKMKIIIQNMKKSYNEKYLKTEEQLEALLKKIKTNFKAKSKEALPKVVKLYKQIKVFIKTSMDKLRKNIEKDGMDIKKLFHIIRVKEKKLFLSIMKEIKNMPKNKLFAKMLTVMIMFTLMVPITTVKASTVTINDLADRLTPVEEQTLEQKIKTLSDEYDVDVLLTTTKEDIGKDDHHAYMSDVLKATYPESDSSIGILFDFYKSTYTIVPQGKILLHVTEEEIDAAYDICDAELKKMNPSIYGCCTNVFEALLSSATTTEKEEIQLKETVRNTTETLSPSVPTEESLEPIDNIYMRDLADLLTSDEETKLIEWIRKEYKNNQYNILFLTTNNTDGKSTMVYSDDYMDQLFPNTDENIAFVIDMSNREIYVNTMGTTIQKLDDADIDRALDLGFKKITDSKYYDCMKVMSEYCLNDLCGKSNFFATFTSNMVGCILFALIATVVVIIILLLMHRKANKAIQAAQYESKEDYEIIDKDVVYERSYQTVQRDYYKPKSSGSSGGSSHRSSSGRSHGGGGRSF